MDEHHFNGLTPAEAERLAMLTEECAEVIQIIGKILRHGYESYHPEDPQTTNRMRLMDELNDINGVLFGMCTQEDLSVHDFSSAKAAAAWEKKLKWSHHQ